MNGSLCSRRLLVFIIIEDLFKLGDQGDGNLCSRSPMARIIIEALLLVAE